MNEEIDKSDKNSRPGGIIDCGSLAMIFWQQRVFIVSGFLILTIMGALFVFLAPDKFQCEAFYQVGVLVPNKQNKELFQKSGLPIPKFKEGELLLHDLNNLRHFIALEQNLGEDEKKKFLKQNKNKVQLKKYFSPVANFTQIARLDEDMGSSVVGFKLTCREDTPEAAERFIKLFASYIRNTYLSIDLGEYIQRSFESYRRSFKVYENKEKNLQGQLERFNKRKTSLEAQARRFPGYSRIDEQQLQKMTKPSSHYLSPTLQLKVVESQLLSLTQTIEANELEKESSFAAMEFFSRAQKLMGDKGDKGIGLLSKLDALKNEMFSEKSRKSPAMFTTINNLEIDLQRFHDIYFGIFKIASGPSIVQTNTLPKRMCWLLLVVFLNLLVISALALLLVWGSNIWKRMVA